MSPIIFETETSDPDDFVTLLWLADHPGIDLRGVVVTPGSKDQCQLVRWGLDQCGRSDTRLGALHGPSWWDTRDGQKERVSGFHRKAFGSHAVEYAAGDVECGPVMLADMLRDDEITMLVGAAPRNLGRAFEDDPGLRLSRWVQRGGFAGDNLVSNPLEKFKGRVTCPSFNLGGAPKQTLSLLGTPGVARRLFVSKNVCHRVIWTRDMEAAFKLRMSGAAKPTRVGVAMMIRALRCYLAEASVGKAVHDLLAAACVVDECVCDFREVEIYREKGEWGAHAAAGTNTWISVGFHEDRFLDVLAQR